MTTFSATRVTNGLREAYESPDGWYRYLLRERFDKDPATDVKPVVFCMLNPSKAGAFRNDPTWTRCCTFARSFGGTSVTVVNVYAYRATDPRDLRAVIRDSGEAVAAGGLNEKFLRELPANALRIVAWGAGLPRVSLARDRAINHLAGSTVAPYRLACLGITSAGEPRHPLFLASDTRLQLWRSGNAPGWAEPEREGRW